MKRLRNARVFVGDVEIGHGNFEVTMDLPVPDDQLPLPSGPRWNYTVEGEFVIIDPVERDALRRSHKAPLN